MKAVECMNVSKSFGSKKVLEDISFACEKGGIYALLGRNGAGKTTLLNCLCTKYLPDSGEICLLGEKAYENEKVLKEICFMSEYIEAFELKKVDYILKYAARFYEKWNEDLMNRLLNYFELGMRENYAALSKGQQTAVSIIIGLCSGCEIVLFDEIYSGLDAVVRQGFYDILLEEQEENPRTFILSTHLIDEMTGIFTDVVIIDQGRLILSEDMETLHKKSYRCMGRTENEDCLKGKNILVKKEMGTVAEYHIYDEFSELERKELEEQGLTFSSLSLQELFIAYTSESRKEWWV